MRVTAPVPSYPACRREPTVDCFLTLPSLSSRCCDCDCDCCCELLSEVVDGPCDDDDGLCDDDPWEDDETRALTRSPAATPLWNSGHSVNSAGAEAGDKGGKDMSC